MTGTHESSTWKKVVFCEPGRSSQAITGQLSEEGEFFKVRNERGEMLIARKAVICIKNARPEARE